MLLSKHRVGYPGLATVLARMEREREATMQTVPPPTPRYTLDWLAGQCRVQAPYFRAIVQGKRPPPDWFEHRVQLLTGCTLKELCGLD